MSNVVTERGVSFCWVTRYRPTGRHCSRCNQFLPFASFRPNLRLKSGWHSWCKTCCVERTRQWRAEHPELRLSRPRVAPSKLKCVECGVAFEGRKDRLVGSRRCKDKRYARLHPDQLRAKERRKHERRRNAG
jgi:hypothetical protein